MQGFFKGGAGQKLALKKYEPLVRLLQNQLMAFGIQATEHCKGQEKVSVIIKSPEASQQTLSVLQVKDINALEANMQKLSDTQLRDKTAEFKKRLKNREQLDDLLVEAFAVHCRL